MKILRLFFYSFILLIIISIAIGFFIVSNGDLFNPSERGVHVVQAPPLVTRLPATNAPITPDIQPNQAFLTDVIADLNAARSSAGAPILTLNSKLNAAAAVQAFYNSQLGELSHDGPNGDRVGDRVTAQGYLWRGVGENLLSRWTLDGHASFKQWQGSPDHNKNMMNPKFTELGLAYMISNEGEVFYAMVLGMPK